MSNSEKFLIQYGDKVIVRKNKNLQIANVSKNNEYITITRLATDEELLTRWRWTCQVCLVPPTFHDAFSLQEQLESMEALPPGTRMVFDTKYKKCNLEKLWFDLSGAVGHPFGTVFEVKGSKITPTAEDKETFQAVSDRVEQGKDNRHIVDNSSSQNLSRDQIEEMRKRGEKGEDVVRQLVENSSSFKDKTEFSQEKYIRKKNKKHLNRIKIVRPNTRLIAEMFFNKGPARINFLRVDALAQMMAYGNVHVGARQLVVESCNGLLLAATLERMAADSVGSDGSVIVQLHQEQDPPRQALEGYPFTDEQLGIIHSLPLKFLGKVKNVEIKEESIEADNIEIKEESIEADNDADLELGLTPHKKPRLDEEDENTNGLENDEMDQGESEAEKNPSITVKEEQATQLQDSNCKSDKKSATEVPSRSKKERTFDKEALELRRSNRRAQIDETKGILREGNFDSLLIAARVHPTPIAVRLLEYLKDSSPVCIFSPYKEPLVDCYQRLRDSGLVIHLRLTETWLRNYQVLPQRTHPEINMSTNGGYLLTFIKVSTLPPPPSDG